jgi:LPPG:FO 2-phospho-L-lactate transferase
MEKVTVLAGGVGGAKLVDGLAQILPPEKLNIIVNTGDDFEYLGLKISPDLDTVCYTLAGIANPETGWGLRDETWNTYQELAALGGPDWFQIGDHDLATHLFRTEGLRKGRKLSEITRDLCAVWGMAHIVYPMSDEPVQTIVHTEAGEALGFQEYFVHQACRPVVKSFEFAGIEKASPVPAALQGLIESDIVIFAPSNPWVSIGPILAVPGMTEEILQKKVIAVSPIIGGKALKGPAAKMYMELGLMPSALAVAQQYQDYLSGFAFDTIDAAELEKIERCRIIPLVTDVVMRDQKDRVRLAKELLSFSETIHFRRQ